MRYVVLISNLYSMRAVADSPLSETRSVRRRSYSSCVYTGHVLVQLTSATPQVRHARDTPVATRTPSVRDAQCWLPTRIDRSHVALQLYGLYPITIQSVVSCCLFSRRQSSNQTRAHGTSVVRSERSPCRRRCKTMIHMYGSQYSCMGFVGFVPISSHAYRLSGRRAAGTSSSDKCRRSARLFSCRSHWAPLSWCPVVLGSRAITRTSDASAA